MKEASAATLAATLAAIQRLQQSVDLLMRQLAPAQAADTDLMPQAAGQAPLQQAAGSKLAVFDTADLLALRDRAVEAGLGSGRYACGSLQRHHSLGLTCCE